MAHEGPRNEDDLWVKLGWVEGRHEALPGETGEMRSLVQGTHTLRASDGGHQGAFEDPEPPTRASKTLSSPSLEPVEWPQSLSGINIHKLLPRWGLGPRAGLWSAWLGEEGES